MSGHGAHEAAEYVPRELKQQWASKDPILCFESYLTENSLLSKEDIGQLQQAVEREVDEAIGVAERSPYPEPKDLLEGVYADGGETAIPVKLHAGEG